MDEEIKDETAVRAEHPGINRKREDEDVKIGTSEATEGVGHQTDSKTEAMRGTSG